VNYKLGFVLSTGRTGTVFITKRLSQLYPDILSVHEPGKSRYQYLLGNFAKQWPVVTPLLHRWFWSSRPEIYKSRESYPEGYIEVNPFLCSFADVLIKLETPLRIVHVVRDPYDWISSLFDFKASGYRKGFINYMPYNQPTAPERTATNHIERLAWRWRLYNENILHLEQYAACYSQIKFEDLFSNNVDDATAAFGAIPKTFELGHIDSELLDDRKKENANPNPKGTLPLIERITAQELQRVQSIVAPVAELLGYEL
jgi:hypothetical protein